MDEEEEIKPKKTRKVKASSDEVHHEVKHKEKDGVSFFALAIVAIIILGIIGVVFGYTKDQLGKVQNKTNNKSLENQVGALKQQLNDLTSKAANLEAENSKNQAVVLDLFEKNRSLPDSIDTTKLVAYENAEAGVKFFLPNNWTVVSATKAVPVVAKDEKADPTKKTEPAAQTPDKYVLVLQPQNDSLFVNAITIQDDYLEFWKASIKDKTAMFEGLTFIDRQDTPEARLLYFVDKDTNLPSVIILTTDRIMKATFNVADKKMAGYMAFRVDFENIIPTISFPVPKPAATVEPKPAVVPVPPVKN